MEKSQALIYESIYEANVLPITSRCNLDCIFCSNKQNPRDLEEVKISPLTVDEVKDAAMFLDESKKIIIGESATKISEGEPFLHPDIVQILKFLRVKFPKTSIQITTNGTMIDDSILAELKLLAPLEINLSINMLDKSLRWEYMGDKPPFNAINLPEKFNENNIVYNGSVVDLSYFYGKEELFNTLKYLEANGTRTIRIFVPGGTYLNENLIKMPSIREVVRALKKIKKDFETPILIEPPLVEDLRAEVAGVARNSPAWFQGIKAGDEITMVNEMPVFSRADAYYLIKENKNPIIKLKHENGEDIEKVFNKEKIDSGGICFDYDISKQEIEALAGLENNNKIDKKGKKIMVLASRGGYDIVTKALQTYKPESKLEVHKVESNYLQGNIISAGLLVVDDFICYLKSQFEIADLRRDYGLIVLPKKAFDQRGIDLKGEHYLTLEALLGVKVTVC